MHCTNFQFLALVRPLDDFIISTLTQRFCLLLRSLLRAMPLFVTLLS